MVTKGTGVWSLKKIVSAVKGNLEAGLKITGNYNFSDEHLEHVIIAARAELIEAQKRAGINLDLEDLGQEINCIPLDCEMFSLCCERDTMDNVLHFEIPPFIELGYVGLVNRHTPFKIYTDTGYIYNQYRDPRLRSRPYIVFRYHNEMHHGFLFNPPTTELNTISVTAILDNPMDANKYDCCPIDPEEGKFPIGNDLVNQLISKITNEWSSWMYRFQGGNKVNNQTSNG